VYNKRLAAFLLSLLARCRWALQFDTFVCTTQSLLAPINLPPAHSPATAQFESHSLSELVRPSSRPSPRPRATRTTLPRFLVARPLPITVARSFLLFPSQHRACCSRRRRHISSRPAVASGLSRTKCGELRERLLGPKRALGGQTGGHHGPTTTNCIPLIVEAVRHKHRWEPRAVWEVRGQLAGRESGSVASRH
jgi:hypothetical protein